MSKHNMVKKYLIEKGSITSWEAITKFRATRLSAIIYNLRDRGYDIETEMHHQDGTPYAKYILRGEPNND